jgi:hypothetical protein
MEMSIGDYVKVTGCANGCQFGYIMGFDTWTDEVGDFEMIEVLSDGAFGQVWLPADILKVVQND